VVAKDELYNRDFALVVGGETITSQTGDRLQPEKIDTQLRVSFVVELNSNKDPNRADVSVYNYNLENRVKLQTGNEIAERTRQSGLAYDWPLVIEAGYMGSRDVIFSGNINYATSMKDTVDWISDIEAEDAGNKYRNQRMNKSYEPGTSVSQVAIDAATLLDVGPGNLAERLGTGIFRKGFSVFSQGYVASGSAQQVLDDLISSAGYNWSVQDGNLQILAPTETTFEETIVLNKDSGLIGSPQKGEKGSIMASSLLRGKINPGRKILIESNLVNGIFKVDKVTHYGDTAGNEWYSDIEAKPV
jgi:hypothetical protein